MNTLTFNWTNCKANLLNYFLPSINQA
jgi:hypothetical protein